MRAACHPLHIQTTLATLLFAMTTAAPAGAYETDQLTDRMVELHDAAEFADRKVNDLLSLAMEDTNTQTQCRGSERHTRAVLARNVYRQMADPTYVRGRGELAGFGYGAYAAWLETDPRIDRREVGHYDDIYTRVRPVDSLVLGTVGVCSTIRLAGILMGTDKPDHFWAQGYEYFRTSRGGRRDARAWDRGVADERGKYGLLTSGVFSFADLAANWAGYQFYKGLLTKASPLQRDDTGCVAQASPFRWGDWISDAVDEVLNPSNYVEEVAIAVVAHLIAERSAVCAAYTVWGAEVVTRREAVLQEEAEHLSPNAPTRVDTWRLDVLCKRR